MNGDNTADQLISPARLHAQTIEGARLHTAIRTNKRSPNGHYALGYGLRIGYWPCLKAPYIQIALHRWRLEAWFGLPSYLG